MKKYEKYKNSGAQWIGDIPSHWNSMQLKRLCQVKRGASPRPIDDEKYFDDNGEYAWVRISDVTASGKYLQETEQNLSELGASLSVKRHPGDLFLSIAGSVGKPIITAIKCCIHDGFVWFENLGLSTEYLCYIFLAGEAFKGLGKLGTQLNLNTETVGSIQIPVPPDSEIKSIVSYLDHKTAQLDTLLAQKETLLRLLHQKRQALINEAVTQGLDPTAPRKPSGVAWLGEVPTHWEVKKLKWASTRITDGAHISPDRTSEDYPFVSTVDIKRGKIDFDNCLRTTAESYSYLVNTGCRPHLGDVLFSKDGTVGRTALIDFDKDFVVASSLIIITPNAVVINSEFMEFALQSIVSTNYVESLLSGSALRRISIAKVSNMPIVVPPLHEQEVILDSLKKRFAKIDKATDNIHTQIKTLKVYRQSLISEVVTGKVDVRTEAQALAGVAPTPSPTRQASQPAPQRPAAVGQLGLF